MSNSPSTSAKPVAGLLAQRSTFKRILGYWCVYHAVFWHVLFLYTLVERNQLQAGAPDTFLGEYAAFAGRHFWILLCSAALFPVLAWDGLRTAHRLVGPIARFRQCLKLLAIGECVSQVRIREGDLLVDLQNSLNEFLDSPYNTRRWEKVRAVREVAERSDPVGTAQDSSEETDRHEAQALKSVREIQATLWDPRPPESEPEPVAMAPRDVLASGSGSPRSGG